MPKIVKGKAYYSLYEAAEILEVHPNTIRYWMGNNRVMYRKFSAAKNAKVYIPKDEVDRIQSGVDFE